MEIIIVIAIIIASIAYAVIRDYALNKVEKDP